MEVLIIAAGRGSRFKKTERYEANEHKQLNFKEAI